MINGNNPIVQILYTPKKPEEKDHRVTDTEFNLLKELAEIYIWIRAYKQKVDTIGNVISIEEMEVYRTKLERGRLLREAVIGSLTQYVPSDMDLIDFRYETKDFGLTE